MDAFKLTARLVLNDAEFQGALAAEEGKFGSWGQKIGKLAGAAFVTAFALGAKGLKSAIEKGMSFDQAMSGMKAISGATEDEFETLRKRALELGATTTFTAEEVAEAYGYMAMAGWKPEQMLDGIAGVLDLAAASGEDLAGTSDIVTDALTAFGLKADDTKMFVDVLAQTAANANTNVHMMGESFKYVAPVAGSLNMSVQDTAVALGIMANNGIKASQSGTTLRRLIQTLIDPSDGAAAAMDALGISLYDVDENGKQTIKGLMAIMQEFRGAADRFGIDIDKMEVENADAVAQQLEELDTEYAWIRRKVAEAQKEGNTDLLKTLYGTDEWHDYSSRKEIITNQLGGFLSSLAEIGGARGLPGLMAIIAATDEDFDSLTESVYNSKDAAEKMAGTKLDNLAGDVKILNSALEGLQILVSDEYKLKFRQFVQALTEGIGDLSQAFQDGGMVGMLTSLADWMIDGIADALSDDKITEDKATEFGNALGEFVGHLVKKLLDRGPEILSGLFEAGVSLASGLAEGLFFGLFGGDSSLAHIIGEVKGEEQDAIDEANANAVKAQGIVTYMETLQQQYGSAVTNTEQWKTALEELKKVFPEVTTLIDKESGSLKATNAELKAYIENSKQAAIEDAKRKAVQGLTEAYTKAAYDQAEQEVRAEMAKYSAEEARDRLIKYIQQYEAGYTGKAANGEFLQIGDIASAAYSYANDRGESQDYIKTLVSTFNEQTTKYQEASAKAAELATATAQLKAECEIAEAALAKMATEASSFKAPSVPSISMNSGQYANWFYGGGAKKQAKGDWYVPYDDYPSLLHRGEMVLTASQARQYREGSGVDLSGLGDKIVAAIREGMADAQVTANVNGRNLTSMVNTITSNELKGRRFVT